MTRRDKIQYLLISHLLSEGHIKLNLPDRMIVELGIVKEDQDGKLKKKDNYSWLIASQKDREVSIDSFNLGLKFFDENEIILQDDSDFIDGKNQRILNLI